MYDARESNRKEYNESQHFTKGLIKRMRGIRVAGKKGGRRTRKRERDEEESISRGGERRDREREGRKERSNKLDEGCERARRRN